MQAFGNRHAGDGARPIAVRVSPDTSGLRLTTMTAEGGTPPPHKGDYLSHIRERSKKCKRLFKIYFLIVFCP